MTPKCILEREQKLVQLCEQYPELIPLEAAAAYLGMSVKGLRHYLEARNDSFGLFYRNGGDGRRAYFISTLPFYKWQTRGLDLSREVQTA